MPTLFKWSPRSDDSPASQTSSRFSSLHHNVRSIINGSSIYSQSPALPGSQSPKSPFLGFLRRDHSPPAPLDTHTANNPPHSSSSADSRSPLHPQHTATSYMRSIGPFQDPQPPEMVYRRDSDVPDRHPADVQLSLYSSADPETVVLSDDIQRRRRRRRHRRRKHHGSSSGSGLNSQGQRGWVRRKQHHHHQRGKKRGGKAFDRGTAARGKLIACSISGLFLATVLAIYLSLALTRPLGQELHILFIMIVLATTIFFAHSLLRLCMLLLRPAPPPPPSLPNMMSEEGFHPVNPIRVHLARDEDLERGEGTYDGDDGDAGVDGDAEKDVQLPPPAYGLWRSSVRVDPNLLHWRKVDEEALSPPQGLGLRSSVMSSSTRNNSVVGSNLRNTSVISANTRNASVISSNTGVSSYAEGPRPPSYASDDGVEYVVEARARSVAPSAPSTVQSWEGGSVVAQSHSGVSDIHPAWRPGYAV